jgi:hypothetical protein
MSANITTIHSGVTISTYIVVAVCSLFIIISTLICLTIIILTFITPILHSPTNLLVSNTCLCTLIFSIISIINTFFFYIESTSSDWSCRIRGYLNYLSMYLVVYSYVIQAISRLFWTVLYKYRYLLTIKCHLYLIVFQIFLSFLFPLSTLINKNIIFRPFKLCLVPIQYRIHSLYLLTIGYIIPIISIIMLYVIIYYRAANSSSNIGRSIHTRKRDIKLARNILILFSIFLFGGVPVTLYIILSGEMKSLPTGFYLFCVATPSIAVTIEKIATLMLNKEIRKTVKRRWIVCCSCCGLFPTHVQPILPSDNTNRRTTRATNKIVLTTYM